MLESMRRMLESMRVRMPVPAYVTNISCIQQYEDTYIVVCGPTYILQLHII
jgi:hypothetical protein